MREESGSVGEGSANFWWMIGASLPSPSSSPMTLWGIWHSTRCVWTISRRWTENLENAINFWTLPLTPRINTWPKERRRTDWGREEEPEISRQCQGRFAVVCCRAARKRGRHLRSSRMEETFEGDARDDQRVCWVLTQLYSVAKRNILIWRGKYCVNYLVCVLINRPLPRLNMSQIDFL